MLFSIKKASFSSIKEDNYEHMFVIFVENFQQMARQKKNRLIQRAPSFGGFKPFGVQHSVEKEVVLTIEEYEAFVLCDNDLLKHEEAATTMGVSRPTFTRIYSSARQKLARAMVEAAVIRIEGGSVEVATRWFRCSICEIDFNVEENAVAACPLCGCNEVLQNS